MLMAYGDGFQLPDNVPANEFLNLEGDKISTSRNWAVWLHEYLRDFPGKQDVLRYVLTANAPETKDNDFTWADFQARNNNELVAILGNFVNRVMVLTHKYFGGVVPVSDSLTAAEEELFAEVGAVKERLTAALEGFHFREALREAMELARLGNRYLQESEPWKVARTDMPRVQTILWTALQLCGSIAVAFEPFMPFMAEKMRSMMRLDKLTWDDLGSRTIVAPGTELAQPELLFDKIDDAAVEAQKARLEQAKHDNQVAAWKPEPQEADVDFDTFCRCDLRVGTVKECVKVPKADKLLKFLIDDGTGTDRTIVSGIAKHYDPATLVGRQVVFISNLPPRKLKGIVSEGMLLSAENADGSLTLLAPGAEATPGARVK